MTISAKDATNGIVYDENYAAGQISFAADADTTSTVLTSGKKDKVTPPKDSADSSGN